MGDVKIRTREELLLPEFNYYIFFKISPDEKSLEEIKKCLLAVRNKWTQGLPIQRRYMELWSDVENVMINNIGFDSVINCYAIDNARELELENAKKIKLGRASKLIQIMAKRGVLFKSELLKMASAEKNQWFTVYDLEMKIKSFIEQGVLYIDDTQPVIDIIDFRKYKHAERDLMIAKKGNLYDVIGGTPADSIEDLSRYISATYANLRGNLRNQTTPEGNATSKLLGIAKIIFDTEESKSKYDDFLKVKDSVFDELELRQDLGIHEIDICEFLIYTQIIKERLGLNNEKAAIYLGAALKEYKIVITKDNMQ